MADEGVLREVTIHVVHGNDHQLSIHEMTIYDSIHPTADFRPPKLFVPVDSVVPNLVIDWIGRKEIVVDSIRSSFQMQ